MRVIPVRSWLPRSGKVITEVQSKLLREVHSSSHLPERMIRDDRTLWYEGRSIHFSGMGLEQAMPMLQKKTLVMGLYGELVDHTIDVALWRVVFVKLSMTLIWTMSVIRARRRVLDSYEELVSRIPRYRGSWKESVCSRSAEEREVNRQGE